MQVIDADWQSKIELHIVTMKAAADRALSVPPGDEHTKRLETYEGTCHDFLHHVRTHYNSVEEFDGFLKSQARETFRLSGQSDIPRGYWQDFREIASPVADAENLASHYTYVFKSLTEHAPMSAGRAMSHSAINHPALEYTAS